MKLRYVAGLLGALLIAGCGEAEIEPLDSSVLDDIVIDGEEGDLSQALTTLFNMNRLLEDTDLTGYQWVTPAQVRAFLKLQGSYLASYTDPAWGKSAAVLIVERSIAHNISPLYMLSRIQIESRLITSGTSTNLSKATGCGCPDSGGCSRSYAGFGNQVECAAAKIRGYLKDLNAGDTTVSGWKAGQAKRTLDPCTVTPGNKATAALYTYTPWVGAYGSQCGRNDVGGSSLVAAVFTRFKAAYNWGAPVPVTTCYSGTVAQNVPNTTCVQSASDALWRQCQSGNFTEGTTAKPSGCPTPSYPYCSSVTVGKSVPTRTCVQSRGDRAWRQCAADGAWAEAPNAGSTGSGPLGACAAAYGL